MTEGTQGRGTTGDREPLALLPAGCPVENPSLATHAPAQGLRPKLSHLTDASAHGSMH